MSRFAAFAVLTLLVASPASAATITFEGGRVGVSVPEYTATTITGTNLPISNMVVSDGVSAPVTYDIDGVGETGSLNFSIDGCGPWILGITCTPTTASFIEIVGSVPELGIELQQLMTGTFLYGFGGSTSFLSAVGGGSDTKSQELLLALGIDPATPWQFSLVVPPALAYIDPNTDVRVTNSSEPFVPPTPVPEPTTLLMLSLGTGALAAKHLRREQRP
jgi:hypothetical protein